MGKMEGLLEKNREYQTAIYEFKGNKWKESVGIKRDIKESATKIKSGFDESFKTVNDGENEPYPFGNEFSISMDRRKDNTWRNRSDFKPFTLENDYE